MKYRAEVNALVSQWLQNNPGRTGLTELEYLINNLVELKVSESAENLLKLISDSNDE